MLQERIKWSKQFIIMIFILTCLSDKSRSEYDLFFETAQPSRFAEVSVMEPVKKLKLSKKLLISHKWEELMPKVNCAVVMEFKQGGIGNMNGCGLFGDLEFNYKIKNDTLLLMQYRNVGTTKTRVMWKSGKYFFSGYSLILVEVFEYDSLGASQMIQIPRKFEYLMKEK